MSWLDFGPILDVRNLGICMAHYGVGACVFKYQNSALILLWCAELAVLNQLLLVSYFQRLLRTGDFEEWKITSIVVPILFVLTGLTVQFGHAAAFLACTVCAFILDIFVWLAKRRF